MSIKNYGIYIAFQPTVDLRHQGLGRYLAAFLKGASERKDVRFTVVCPSWSKKDILQLCESENVPEGSFDIVAPAKERILLQLYRIALYLKSSEFSKTNNAGFLKKYVSLLKNSPNKREYCYTLLIALSFSLIFFLSYTKKIVRKLGRLVLPSSLRLKLHSMKQQLLKSKNDSSSIIYKQFIKMYANETNLMLNKINSMDNIMAWYAPTAFWPEFNKIVGSKLMCVPDVVLKDFPVGFALNNKSRHLETFKALENAIYQGDSYVTYSEHVKQDTLIKKYNINKDRIYVVPHATNSLDNFLPSNGSQTPEDLFVFAQQFLASAIAKASNAQYAPFLRNITTRNKNTTLKFFFYASQFRPSKNVLTLLRAYEYLLRKKYIHHKLILTGAPGSSALVDDFITTHRLSKEVLLLPQLSVPELAACYKLADLAINPSLSEGGCPFTFTEALSVNTPVIMARIPVTTEVITDSALQDMMLFDPYNWSDLVKKIEWALQNRETLLNTQLAVYDELKKRRWKHVVDDHITILDKLATGGNRPTPATSEKQAHYAEAY